MMKYNQQIAEQLLNIIISGIYLYFAIQQWNSLTDNDQRMMVCVFATLFIGIQKCFILLKLCFPQNSRLDFHITIMYLIIHIINNGNQIFSIDTEFGYANTFLRISYFIFYTILLFNLFYFSIIAMALLIMAAINLFQIWNSSDSIINREGLTSQEFDSLPKKVITEKEAQNMKSSHHEGIHHEQVNDCAICLSCFEKDEVMIEMIQCKHVFHSECIKIWFKNNVLCPYCRNDVRKSLQKIKREKHQLQHAGHSILDRIVDQAEPSFQLDEFIEDNNLQNPPSQQEQILQQQQIQDINGNQIINENIIQNQINNENPSGRNANLIFQNNQYQQQLNEAVNIHPQQQQQQQLLLQNQQSARNPQILPPSSIENQSNLYRIAPPAQFNYFDEVLSNQQSQQMQVSQSLQEQQQSQQQREQQNQQQREKQRVQKEQQSQQSQQKSQQSQQRQQGGGGVIRIVEPPSPRKMSRMQSHSRNNSFGNNNDKFIEQLQQQHQNVQEQIINSQNQSIANTSNHSPLHFYADGANYSGNKNVLDDFSFYDEYKESKQPNNNNINQNNI